jgi:hypothetical protein
MVVTLEGKVPESKQKFSGSLARRDAWLARNIDEAVLVWDRDDAVLGRLARTLETNLGDDVWIVEP